jgi:hypothetical protein
MVVAPLGCWASSLVLDIASAYGSDPSLLVRIPTWLVGIGLVTAVAAGVACIAAGAPIPGGTRATAAWWCTCSSSWSR